MLSALVVSVRRCQMDVPEQRSERQLVYISLQFKSGVWAGDLNLGVTGIETGLKFTRQENRRTLGAWKREPE